jgi:hypothetical protein
MKITNATFTTSKFTVIFKMEFGTWTHVTITTHNERQRITAHCRNISLDALINNVRDLTLRIDGTSDDVCETTALVSRYWNNETAE